MSHKIDFDKQWDPAVLKGRTAVVTGAANGIGCGIATAFAEAGVSVVIVDIDEELGVKVTDSLKSRGHSAFYYKADVTHWDSLQDAFKAAFDFGPSKGIDIVVPNAGVAGSDVFEQAFPKDLAEGEDLPKPKDSIFHVNLVGVYYSTILAMHYFKKSPPADYKRQIIYMASLAGYNADLAGPDYAATKYAVRAMWKAIRGKEEKMGFPFRSNLIAPTFVKTPLLLPYADAIEAMGIYMAEVDHVVTAVMRFACVEEISGRAIAVTSEFATAFDLEDDQDGHESGKIGWEKAKQGVYGMGIVQKMETGKYPDQK